MKIWVYFLGLIIWLLILSGLTRLYNQLERRIPYRFMRYYMPKKIKNHYMKRFQKSHPFKIVETFNVDPNDKHILSTSLYGVHPIYFNGSLDRADEIKRLLPGWKLRIYCHDKVDPGHIQKLIAKGVQIVIVEDPEIKPLESAGAFWRFLPLGEDVTFIAVDLDHPFPDYLPKVVDHWLNKTDKTFIRACFIFQLPWPKCHLGAGFFGKKAGRTLPISEDMRSRKNFSIKDYIMNYDLRNPFGADEYFLTTEIMPLALKEGIITYYTDPFTKALLKLSPGSIKGLNEECTMTNF